MTDSLKFKKGINDGMIQKKSIHQNKKVNNKVDEYKKKNLDIFHCGKSFLLLRRE